jgi:DNA-binding NarL/FixJ family response regulator
MVAPQSADISTIPSVVGPARTLIVDDHPLFRSALGEVLARYLDFEVVGEAGSVAEALAWLAQHTVDVAIIDVVLPEARAVTLVDYLRTAQPGCRVLALSGVDEPTQIAEMLRAGASGFALKTQPVSEIVGALRCVLGGGCTVPAAARQQVDALLNSPDAWPLERLTPREREVFDLLIAGATNDDITVKLSISKRTVETHRLRVMTKLAAGSLGDLFKIAVRHGLVGRHERESR